MKVYELITLLQAMPQGLPVAILCHNGEHYKALDPAQLSRQLFAAQDADGHLSQAYKSRPDKEYVVIADDFFP